MVNSAGRPVGLSVEDMDGPVFFLARCAAVTDFLAAGAPFHVGHFHATKNAVIRARGPRSDDLLS